MDKIRFELVHTTANYVKGGRLVVDKVEAAKSKFFATIGELVTIGKAPTLQNGEIDLNAVFSIATKQAAAMDKAAAKEAEAKREAEAAERKTKREDKKFESYSVEELEAIILRKKAALSAK